MNGRSTNETDGISRRSFLQAGGGAAGAVIGAAGLSAETPVMAETALGFAQAVTTRLSINGKPMSITHEARVSLLDLLRERLQMTGTKKGCNEGACGLHRASRRRAGQRLHDDCRFLRQRRGYDGRGARRPRWRSPRRAAGLHRP